MAWVPAAARIQFLAWELPCALGLAIKKKKIGGHSFPLKVLIIVLAFICITGIWGKEAR